jgi:hypothetical protein
LQTLEEKNLLEKHKVQYRKIPAVAWGGEQQQQNLNVTPCNACPTPTVITTHSMHIIWDDEREFATPKNKQVLY